MKRMVFLILIALVAALTLSACAQTPSAAQAMENYLKTRVAADADKLRSLSCLTWESQAVNQANSFRAMNAQLEGLACSESGRDGDFTLVTCEGHIVTTYNGETRQWELGTYRMTEEAGEWKMCGEADTP